MDVRERGKERAEGTERERRTDRAVRLAENYMAFVSDGAFNDLSTSRRVFSSFNRSLACVRIRCSRAACCGKKLSAQQNAAREADRIESIESNSRCEFTGKVSGVRSALADSEIRRWNCLRLDTY